MRLTGWALAPCDCSRGSLCGAVPRCLAPVPAVNLGPVPPTNRRSMHPHCVSSPCVHACHRVTQFCQKKLCLFANDNTLCNNKDSCRSSRVHEPQRTPMHTS